MNPEQFAELMEAINFVKTVLCWLLVFVIAKAFKD